MFKYTIVFVIFPTLYLIAINRAAQLRSKELLRLAPALLPGERSQVESVLVDAYCKRATEDQDFLKSFLDDYLGDATAAKRQTLDKALQDPNSIQEMVSDSLQKKKDEQLVADLVKNQQYLPKHAETFDPNRRLAQRRESRQLLTSADLGVAVLGLFILLLMLVVPPWVRQEDDVTWMLWSVESREVQSEEFVGYRFILSPRLPDVIENISTGDLGRTRQKRERTLVALHFLIPQLLCVTTFFPVVIYRLRKPHFKP